MNAHDIHHLPAVDAAGRVQEFILRQDLAFDSDQAWNERRLRAVIIAPEASISEGMAQLDKAGTGVLLICDKVRHLIGLLTDGDFRRGILKRKSLSEPCATIASSHPITAPVSVSSSEALRLMKDHDVSSIACGR